MVRSAVRLEITLEPVVEPASERGSHRSQSVGFSTAASDNEFMDIDPEASATARAPEDVKMSPRPTDDEIAAPNVHRQVTITSPSDPAAASSSPDYSKDNENSQSMSENEDDECYGS